MGPYSRVMGSGWSAFSINGVQVALQSHRGDYKRKGARVALAGGASFQPHGWSDSGRSGGPGPVRRSLPAGFGPGLSSVGRRPESGCRIMWRCASPPGSTGYRLRSRRTRRLTGDPADLRVRHDVRGPFRTASHSHYLLEHAPYGRDRADGPCPFLGSCDVPLVRRYGDLYRGAHGLLVRRVGPFYDVQEQACSKFRLGDGSAIPGFV